MPCGTCLRKFSRIIAAPSGSPLLAFGLIADIQFADIDDGASFAGFEKRGYRRSLITTSLASRDWVSSSSKFVVNLGDAIDGANARIRPPQGLRALSTVLSTLSPLDFAPMPVYHTLGNHELLNFERAQLPALLPLPPDAVMGPKEGSHDADRLYYHVDPAPGWRLVFLDTYDIAYTNLSDGDTPSPQHCIATALLRANNPNPSAYGAGTGDFFTGLEGTGTRNRWVPFNGAVGDAQLAWLAETLTEAAAQGRGVLVFSHVLLHDGAERNGGSGGVDNVHKCLAWNYEEVRWLLGSAGCVVAVFSGHLHDGAFGVDAAGISHVTIESPLTHPEGAYAVVRLYEEHADLQGYGAVPSRTLPKRTRS